MTAQTDMASITPRVFNAEIGAFTTPKYCGSSSCELGRRSRPSSDRYRWRLWGRGSSRGCGMPAPGTPENGIVHASMPVKDIAWESKEGVIPRGGLRGVSGHSGTAWDLYPTNQIQLPTIHKA